jgi:hypothetical protein
MKRSNLICAPFGKRSPLLLSKSEGNGTLMKSVWKMRASLAAGNTWEELWQDGLTPWDLGRPTPLLIGELRGLRERYVAKGKLTTMRLRSLIPGCGEGHDILSIADHHDVLIRDEKVVVEQSSVIALDIAPTSLGKAEKKVKEWPHHESSTSIELKCGDFFADPSQWKTLYCSQNSAERFQIHKFDFIYDYTFFSSLPPTLRQNWGEQIASILEPQGGLLLTIIFPILPDEEMIGPPYPVSVEDYAKVLNIHGIATKRAPFESPHSVRSRAGKELVCYWSFDQ